MSGKGSGRRQQLVPDKVMDKNWKRTFGPKCLLCGKHNDCRCRDELDRPEITQPRVR